MISRHIHAIQAELDAAQWDSERPVILPPAPAIPNERRFVLTRLGAAVGLGALLAALLGGCSVAKADSDLVQACVADELTTRLISYEKRFVDCARRNRSPRYCAVSLCRTDAECASASEVRGDVDDLDSAYRYCASFFN